MKNKISLFTLAHCNLIWIPYLSNNIVKSKIDSKSALWHILLLKQGNKMHKTAHFAVWKYTLKNVSLKYVIFPPTSLYYFDTVAYHENLVNVNKILGPA